MSPRYSNPREMVDGIRKRPAMYLGSKDLTAFQSYLSVGLDMMLYGGASWIEIEPGRSWSIRSDAKIHLETNSLGQLNFVETSEVETIEERTAFGRPYEGAVLNALSAAFCLDVSFEGRRTLFQAKKGVRQVFEQSVCSQLEPTVTLSVVPDSSIFSATEISHRNLHSYFHRNACFFPGVTYRVIRGNAIQEYKSERGLVELFDSFAHPYHILHEPLHVKGSVEKLNLEAVFAFHHSPVSQIISFWKRDSVRLEMIPKGGTHLEGFLDAIQEFQFKHRLFKGSVGILVIEHPYTQFLGAVREEIGNSEFTSQVHELIAAGMEKWCEANPEEARLLKLFPRS